MAKKVYYEKKRNVKKKCPTRKCVCVSGILHTWKTHTLNKGLNNILGAEFVYLFTFPVFVVLNISLLSGYVIQNLNTKQSTIYQSKLYRKQRLISSVNITFKPMTLETWMLICNYLSSAEEYACVELVRTSLSIKGHLFQSLNAYYKTFNFIPNMANGE